MKKCPHNRKSLRQVSQYKNEIINEDVGVIKGKDEVLVETYEFDTCPEGGCGVWVEGFGCNYHGRYYPGGDELEDVQ